MATAPIQPTVDALVVTVAKYPNSNNLIRDLPGASCDSRRVCKYLKSRFPNVALTEITWPLPPDGDADMTQLWDRYRVEASMNGFARRGMQQTRDRLFVYFSGHGRSIAQAPAMPMLYCACHSTTQADIFAPFGWVQILTNAPFYREYMFFFDCCNEWQPDPMPALPSLDLPIRDDRPKVLVVAACRPNQQALDTPQGGVFTDVLMEALSGSAGTDGPSVTARDVVDYLYEQVPIRANAVKAGHEQMPRYWMDPESHTDLESFTLFDRAKVQVDVSGITTGRDISRIEVLDIGLEPAGTSIRADDGDGKHMLDVYPGQYVLRESGGWRQLIRVWVVMDANGDPVPRMKPLAGA